MSESQMPTARTRVVREADRAVYDRKTVYRILDEGLLCHAGFIIDGQPFVIPTSYGHKDASLYIHGSAASRMLRQMGYRKLSARPHHHAQDPAAPAVFKKALPPAWQRSPEATRPAGR